MTQTTPQRDRLAADTAMGPVTLDVADLEGMTAYYRDAVTLQVLSEDGPVVTLGRAGTPIIATWNARDGRWFTGAQMVQPQFVRAYCPIPVYEGET